MKKALLILLLCGLAVPPSVEAMHKDAGTAGASFLKIGQSARVGGMGGAFTAIGADAACLNWNPAGLAQIRSHRHIYTTYGKWFADTNFGNISYASPFGKKSSLGMSLTYLDYGELDASSSQDDYGVPLVESSFKASDMSFSCGYAKDINFLKRNVRIGFALKGVRLAIAADDAIGYGLDAGINHNLSDRLSVGFVMKNLGVLGKMDGETDPLPQDMRLGGVYKIIHSKNHSLLLSVDGVAPADNNMHYLSGLEYGFKNRLFMRAGYRGNYDTDRLTAGIGIRYKNMLFDYAYAPYEMLDEATHRFSFGLSFASNAEEEPAVDPYEQMRRELSAMREQSKESFAEAEKEAAKKQEAHKLKIDELVRPSIPIITSSSGNEGGEPEKMTIDKTQITTHIREEGVSIVMNYGVGIGAMTADDRKKIEAKINEIRKVLSNAVMVIEGHTDSAGNERENLVLSYKRAWRVYEYLLDDVGIPAENMKVKAMGEAHPIADNKTEEGRYKNRRVEIFFVK